MQTNEIAAKIGTTTTVVSAGVSLASVNQIVQIVAGIVAICVGVATFIYYVKRIRNMNHE